MGILLGILLGFELGAFLFWGRLIMARKAMLEENERAQHLRQEKEIVSGFTHHLTEGLGEDLDREELYRRIAHAAIQGTGALASCVFIRDENDRLQPAASEGLFPPQKQGRRANPACYDSRA